MQHGCSFDTETCCPNCVQSLRLGSIYRSLGPILGPEPSLVTIGWNFSSSEQRKVSLFPQGIIKQSLSCPWHSNSSNHLYRCVLTSSQRPIQQLPEWTGQLGLLLVCKAYGGLLYPRESAGFVFLLRRYRLIFQKPHLYDFACNWGRKRVLKS